MRFAFVIWLGFALTASAQQTGGFGGGAGSGSSSGLGGGSSSGTGFGGGSGSGSSTSTAGVSAQTLLGSFPNTSVARNNSAISSANPLASYYYNPYAQGLVSGTGTGSSSSITGFGQAVYSSSNLSSSGAARTGSSTSGSLGSANTLGSAGSRSTGTTGTSFGGSSSGASSSMAGGFGGGGTGVGQQTGNRTNTGTTQGGTAGIPGTGNTGMANRSQQQSNFAPATASGLKTGVLYTTTIRFETTPVSATQLQSQLAQIISRSTHLKSPGSVRVELENGTVVLRGNVANEDESAHVENLLRLEPGVRDVKNELQVR